jgi:hypothetical protein
MGTKGSFAIQAGICAFAFLLVIRLQIFSKQLGICGGKLNFHTSQARAPARASVFSVPASSPIHRNYICAFGSIKFGVADKVPYAHI